MADVYIHSLTDLWNDAGTDYHAIKMNVTNSASSAASRLLTLQVGGADRFYVDKNGAVVAAGALKLTANDGGALGASGTGWSDLFLASGGVINWNAGDVTATHAANALAFAGASSGYSFDAAVLPSANDAAALGSASVSWADLFLASGGVLNFNNGDVTITHAANALAFAGATTNGYSFADGPIKPAANDGAALGISGTAWSDLFLASGAVVNFAAGDLTMTHSSGSLAISSASAGTLLTLESTDAGALAGPTYDLYRNSASPASNDNIGRIMFNGKDSAGNKKAYADIVASIIDPTSTSEDGLLDFRTTIAGTYAVRFNLGAGLYANTATGGDKGNGTVNAVGFYKNGAEFGNDVADQVVTGGVRITSLSLGTITTGTVTPDPGDRPMQHYTNGGAHTLAPGSNAGFYTLDITNNGSAGAITTSGWTKVSGSVFTTTNGHKFRCSCSIGDGGSLIAVQALQ